MGLTVALFATLALATSADAPQDAATWRAQSDALYSQGDFHGALEAAERARLIDPTDPWSRYAWIRALAAVDPDAARREMAGIEDPVGTESISRGRSCEARHLPRLPMPRPRHRTSGCHVLRRCARIRRRATRRRKPGSRYSPCAAGIPARRSTTLTPLARPCARILRSPNSSVTRATTSCCMSSRQPATCATPTPPDAPIRCSTSCGPATHRRCRLARTLRTFAATCRRANGRCATCLQWTPRRRAPPPSWSIRSLR